MLYVSSNSCWEEDSLIRFCRKIMSKKLEVKKKKGEKRCEAEIGGRDQHKGEMNIGNQRANVGMLWYSFGGILSSVKKKTKTKK